MTSEQECYVYIVLPGATEFITAGRFEVSRTPDGDSVGQFFYGRRYLERSDAVELDPNVGGRDVLLVRRFDRERTENGYQRHRMVSALTDLIENQYL